MTLTIRLLTTIVQTPCACLVKRWFSSAVDGCVVAPPPDRYSWSYPLPRSDRRFLGENWVSPLNPQMYFVRGAGMLRLNAASAPLAAKTSTCGSRSDA